MAFEQIATTSEWQDKAALQSAKVLAILELKDSVISGLERELDIAQTEAASFRGRLEEAEESRVPCTRADTWSPELHALKADALEAEGRMQEAEAELVSIRLAEQKAEQKTEMIHAELLRLKVEASDSSSSSSAEVVRLESELLDCQKKLALVERSYHTARRGELEATKHDGALRDRSRGAEKGRSHLGVSSNGDDVDGSCRQANIETHIVSAEESGLGKWLHGILRDTAATIDSAVRECSATDASAISAPIGKHDDRLVVAPVSKKGPSKVARHSEIGLKPKSAQDQVAKHVNFQQLQSLRLQRQSLEIELRNELAHASRVSKSQAETEAHVKMEVGQQKAAMQQMHVSLCELEEHASRLDAQELQAECECQEVKYQLRAAEEEVSRYDQELLAACHRLDDAMASGGEQSPRILEQHELIGELTGRILGLLEQQGTNWSKLEKAEESAQEANAAVVEAELSQLGGSRGKSVDNLAEGIVLRVNLEASKASCGIAKTRLRQAVRERAGLQDELSQIQEELRQREYAEAENCYEAEELKQQLAELRQREDFTEDAELQLSSQVQCRAASLPMRLLRELKMVDDVDTNSALRHEALPTSESPAMSASKACAIILHHLAKAQRDESLSEIEACRWGKLAQSARARELELSQELHMSRSSGPAQRNHMQVRLSWHMDPGIVIEPDMSGEDGAESESTSSAEIAMAFLETRVEDLKLELQAERARCKEVRLQLCSWDASEFGVGIHQRELPSAWHESLLMHLGEVRSAVDNSSEALCMSNAMGKAMESALDDMAVECKHFSNYLQGLLLHHSRLQAALDPHSSAAQPNLKTDTAQLEAVSESLQRARKDAQVSRVELTEVRSELAVERQRVGDLECDISQLQAREEARHQAMLLSSGELQSEHGSEELQGTTIGNICSPDLAPTSTRSSSWSVPPTTVSCIIKRLRELCVNIAQEASPQAATADHSSLRAELQQLNCTCDQLIAHSHSHHSMPGDVAEKMKQGNVIADMEQGQVKTTSIEAPIPESDETLRGHGRSSASDPAVMPACRDEDGISESRAELLERVEAMLKLQREFQTRHRSAVMELGKLKEDRESHLSSMGELQQALGDSASELQDAALGVACDVSEKIQSAEASVMNELEEAFKLQCKEQTTQLCSAEMASLEVAERCEYEVQAASAKLAAAEERTTLAELVVSEASLAAESEAGSKKLALESMAKAEASAKSVQAAIAEAEQATKVQVDSCLEASRQLHAALAEITMQETKEHSVHNELKQELESARCKICEVENNTAELLAESGRLQNKAASQIQEVGSFLKDRVVNAGNGSADQLVERRGNLPDRAQDIPEAHSSRAVLDSLRLEEHELQLRLEHLIARKEQHSKLHLVQKRNLQQEVDELCLASSGSESENGEYAIGQARRAGTSTANDLSRSVSENKHAIKHLEQHVSELKHTQLEMTLQLNSIKQHSELLVQEDSRGRVSARRGEEVLVRELETARRRETAALREMDRLQRALDVHRKLPLCGHRSLDSKRQEQEQERLHHKLREHQVAQRFTRTQMRKLKQLLKHEHEQQKHLNSRITSLREGRLRLRDDIKASEQQLRASRDDAERKRQLVATLQKRCSETASSDAAASSSTSAWPSSEVSEVAALKSLIQRSRRELSRKDRAVRDLQHEIVESRRREEHCKESAASRAMADASRARALQADVLRKGHELRDAQTRSELLQARVTDFESRSRIESERLKSRASVVSSRADRMDGSSAQLTMSGSLPADQAWLPADPVSHQDGYAHRATCDTPSIVLTPGAASAIEDSMQILNLHPEDASEFLHVLTT
eukprot:TRINITY_DN20519_c0_g1_i1.p1 TRINITY_DN20519_c0_g1~~TRINITY_DN20519_c0_g1_i1.p1  ORF type:complete len:1820 (-),score=428.75 TRINITY_DN20519_c0_g1_i1:424-5883(-)